MRISFFNLDTCESTPVIIGAAVFCIISVDGCNYCNVHDIIISQFEGFDFYQKFDWYLFRANLQRMMPFITANTQTLITFETYGKKVNSYLKCTFE